MLQDGFTTYMWTSLAGLITFSIIGYILFLRLYTGAGRGNAEDELVAIVFLAAATVVFAVCSLSNYTAKDVAMIAALEHAARVDPLTDLYNRRHVMTLFEAEHVRSKSSRNTLSVLLVDVDRFKAINDTFGHRTGDHVLREISRLISQTKKHRIVGRFGGEEFIAVLPNTSAIEAARFAEQIRIAVESATISFENEDFIPATISVGVAASTRLNETPDELIALADQALYAAKAGGRNRVCTSASPILSRPKPHVPAPVPHMESLLSSMGLSRS